MRVHTPVRLREGSGEAAAVLRGTRGLRRGAGDEDVEEGMAVSEEPVVVENSLAFPVPQQYETAYHAAQMRKVCHAVGAARYSV